SRFNTTNKSNSSVDVIDVFANVDRRLPAEVTSDPDFLGVESLGGSKSRAIGFVAQNVITFNSWLKTFLGVRYSKTQTSTENETTESDAFNPLAGIIVT